MPDEIITVIEQVWRSDRKQKEKALGEISLIQITGRVKMRRVWIIVMRSRPRVVRDCRETKMIDESMTVDGDIHKDLYLINFSSEKAGCRNQVLKAKIQELPELVTKASVQGKVSADGKPKTFGTRADIEYTKIRIWDPVPAQDAPNLSFGFA
ncbi:uncharacterized protein EV420DRAFT_1488713 [Desarmillaria tabescens]|uniref:Uncharacterized protein n=1 Tax=Armillaria tabescens TaxID=1929756 RepID=A0AA39MHQ9_ARMTA|nr:uncharacterized protein EV420DRAFT_1488713 [Desarmillaria tabescens]KAK0434268.1 hypothetical protein EV420DRAFT_1488713 [Desarmillaria tabescens]